MTVWTLFGTLIVWLIIFTLLIRFIFGGIIDVLKKGSKAGFISWFGATVAIVIGLILVAAL